MFLIDPRSMHDKTNIRGFLGVKNPSTPSQDYSQCRGWGGEGFFYHKNDRPFF